jgi:hypothetical protein
MNKYGMFQKKKSHYVENMFKRFEHFDYSPMSRPYDSKIHLVENHSNSVLQEKYAQITTQKKKKKKDFLMCLQ